MSTKKKSNQDALTLISHTGSSKDGRDVRPNSRTIAREHYPTDKARAIVSEDGLADRSDLPSMCEKSGLKILEDLVGEKLTLGNFLYAIRKGEGMTQVGFAQLLGISKQYLCDVERGRRCISPKAAESFAKTLGYSPEQFVRLCLQDMVDKEGINMIINVEAA